MVSNIFIVLLVLVLLFLVYQFVLVRIMKDDDYEQDDEYESFEENARPESAPLVGQKGINLPDDRNIAASGPNSPVSEPPKRQVVVMPPEEPFDPYGEKHQSPHAGDDARYPERMFRPAPEMNDTTTAALSGVASMTADSQYSPEMVENGGEFMSGVFALDSAEGADIGYSAF
jgi:hypothetical protein